MKKVYLFVFVGILINSISALSQGNAVSEMSWGLDYQIYLKMTNDSSYTLNLSDLFHVKSTPRDEYGSEFVYYPVSLGEAFVNDIKKQNPNEENPQSLKTLWSALHETIGGGWVHFSNSMLYALETGQLKLTAPLMERPKTNWKPNPITETYKRTRKWKFYIPVYQKLAIKEYKTRLKNNELGDLKNIPESFIELFLNTSQKEYEKLFEEGKTNITAKIDLVKILLGANYLGEVQIKYIRRAVINAAKIYSANQLPSVIVFDEYNAAAVMTLDEDGYHINQLVFSSKENLKEEEKKQREELIQNIISDINIYNNNSFRKRLEKYYQ